MRGLVAAAVTAAGLAAFIAPAPANAAPVETNPVVICQRATEHSADRCDRYVTVDGQPPALLTLPRCAYEDGNPNGLPCLWMQPRTGVFYYVTSDNYR